MIEHSQGSGDSYWLQGHGTMILRPWNLTAVLMFWWLSGLIRDCIQSLRRPQVPDSDSIEIEGDGPHDISSIDSIVKPREAPVAFALFDHLSCPLLICLRRLRQL
jgi:hypothetical protein